MKMYLLKLSFITMLICLGFGSAMGQVLFDNFDRNDSNVVGMPSSNPGGSYIESENPSGQSNAGQYIRVVNNMLEMRSCVSSAHDGTKAAAFDMTGLYPTTFEDADEILVWNFNMRQDRPNPGGLSSGSYGVAFVLGANEANFGSSTVDGYALVLGEPNPSTDPIRLIHFNDGISTNIVANTIALVNPPETVRNQYYSIKVTFSPCDREWTLQIRDDGATAFADPLTISGAALSGSGIDNTHIGSNLNFMGAYYAHANGCPQKAVFDNIYIPNVSSVTPQTYSWIGADQGDFQEPTNWNPTRSCTRQSDHLEFANISNIEIRNIPNQTIAQLIISNSQVTFRDVENTFYVNFEH